MLSLEEIKEQTIWVAHLYGGTRITGLYKDLEHWYDSDELDELDTVCAAGQPKELQPFWKAYEYAFYHLGRNDLYLVDDFYMEWSKNPEQFMPQMQPVIGNLRDELEIIAKENKNANVIINNYDENTLGNHTILCWMMSIKEFDDNFDVIFVGEQYDCILIKIQETDDDKVEQFDIIANNNARIVRGY
jgi:hypothetical protein